MASAPLFLDPSSYNSLVYGDPMSVNIEDEQIQYPMIELPVGAVLHRADRTGATSPSEAIPAFFGNRESIEVYAGNKGNAAYSSYKVVKPLRLFEMNFNSLRDIMFHPDMTDDDADLLMKYYQLEKGFVLPTLITSKENIKGSHIDYMNRKIARLVCRLGFDGWIVMPLNMEKRQGLIQYVMSRKAKAPYMPEVMICRWSEHLERLPEAIKGGRRTRKARGRRATTRHKKERK
jgi:hypothetical protein